MQSPLVGLSKADVATRGRYLVFRHDAVGAAIDTGCLTAGNTVAYCYGYCISLVLVGPVAADTASFDHFEGMIERAGL